MWYQLKAMLVDYVKCTTDIRKHYSFLKILDTNMSAKLHQQLDRNQELHDLIRRYKDRLARVRKHKITITYDLKDQRQFYQDTFIKQRDRFNKEYAHDRSQLTLLTVESNACMKWLENLADKQERILKIAEICRKMETEQEKVCPFPDSITSQSIEDNKSAGSSDPLIQIFHDFQDLELFWLRVGEADKKRMEMTEYRDLLVLENHYLHHSLQHYLAGLPQLQVPSILQEYYARDKSLCRYKYG
ncbi:dynein regulatory complex subunit 2 [Periplaneta americana]|uniref:dynein regulatory complex subunit 2 n=1 Tax=Periplaneta americana TaxID=6978 RepID=UPI0037E94882